MQVYLSKAKTPKLPPGPIHKYYSCLKTCFSSTFFLRLLLKLHKVSRLNKNKLRLFFACVPLSTLIVEQWTNSRLICPTNLWLVQKEVTDPERHSLPDDPNKHHKAASPPDSPVLVCAGCLRVYTIFFVPMMFNEVFCIKRPQHVVLPLLTRLILLASRVRLDLHTQE